MENHVIKEKEITTTGKVIYTGKTHTIGGRDGGSSKSTDGNLDIKLSTPGGGKPSTNPATILRWLVSLFHRRHEKVSFKSESRFPGRRNR